MYDKLVIMKHIKHSHTNGKTKRINVNQILKMLDTDALAGFALQTNVDFHARKLQGLELLKLHLQGTFLYGNKLSQAAMKRFYESGYYIKTSCKIGGDTITKAAISKRLRHINPEYFRLVYENAVQKWSPILEKYQIEVIPGLHIQAVDSSIVAQTMRILSSGIHAGGRDGSDNGRKGVKYTMAYNGIDVTYAAAHTSPRYADEDNAIGEAIQSMAKKDEITKASSIYTFDRGVKGGLLLSSFKSEGLRFVGRLKNNRKLDVVGDSRAPVGELPADSKLVSDSLVRIYGSDPRNPLPQIFRVVKVDLGHAIGSRSRNRKRTENVLTLITDEPELSVSEIMEIYRFRWTIEVFFKFLKQNLNFSHLMSGSENGLMVILYLTLIEALLLKTYCALNECGPKLGTTEIWLQLGEGIADYIAERKCNSHTSETMANPSENQLIT